MRRLVNVLVAVVVLALAGGLALCAIPKIRDAAARSQCQNNLKQLGMGLHNRRDTYGTFPSATIPNENLPCCERLSWLVDLMPYMEQIHWRMDLKKGWQDEANLIPKVSVFDDRDHEIGVKPMGELKLFRCPTDATVSPTDKASLTNYVGLSGVGPGAADAALGYPGVGFFGCERQIKLEDIKDGTANTLAVMETNANNGPWTAGGFPTVRSLDSADAPYLGGGRPFGSGHLSGKNWWSPTSTVVVTQVLFADGSVRRFTDALRPEVLEALATIAGGEETPPLED